MSEYKLKLEKRELSGKKSQSLRDQGLIPLVIYGGKEPILASAEYVATEKVLRGAGYHSPIDLNYDGKNKLAMLKSVHKNPVSHKIINVEFAAISAREVVEADAPIVIENFAESEASKISHFMYNKVIEEITVKAKPAALPKELTVDASKLVTLEDKLTLGDIVLPEGVEFANKEIDLEQAIISLYDPAAEAAAREAAEAAEAAEAEATTEESTEQSEESAAPAAESTESAEPAAEA